MKTLSATPRPIMLYSMVIRVRIMYILVKVVYVSTCYLQHACEYTGTNYDTMSRDKCSHNYILCKYDYLNVLPRAKATQGH
jgi:hypothetical protein